MAGKPSTGLADIAAASTALSDTGGWAGRLFCRGCDIDRLAGAAAFEEIAWLLPRGGAPGTAQLSLTWTPLGDLTWTPLEER